VLRINPSAALRINPSAALRINQAGTVYRGIVTWVSKHIIVTPNDYQKGIYVDTAGIGGKKMPLPRENAGQALGRSPKLRAAVWRSQSRGLGIIVVAGNELIAKSEVSKATKDRT
jgi:hypothetical protein